MSAAERKKEGAGWKHTLLLLLVVIAVALIPLALERMEYDEETVRSAGRICAGAGLLIILYGLVRNVFRILTLLVATALVYMVLVAEGILELPPFLR